MSDTTIIEGEHSVSRGSVDLTRELVTDGSSLIGKVELRSTAEGVVTVEVVEEFLATVPVESLGFKSEALPDDQQVSTDRIRLEQAVGDEPEHIVYGVTLDESVPAVEPDEPVIAEVSSPGEGPSADEESASDAAADGAASESVEARLDRMSARIEEFAAYTEALEGLIDEHGIASEFFERIDGEIEALERRVEANDEELDAELGAVREELARTRGDIDDLGTEVRRVRGDVDDVRGEVSELSAEVDELRSMREAMATVLTDGVDRNPDPDPNPATDGSVEAGGVDSADAGGDPDDADTADEDVADDAEDRDTADTEEAIVELNGEDDGTGTTASSAPDADVPDIELGTPEPGADGEARDEGADGTGEEAPGPSAESTGDDIEAALSDLDGTEELDL